MKTIIIILKILWWLALACTFYFFALELLGYGGGFYRVVLSLLWVFVIKNTIYILRISESIKNLGERDVKREGVLKNLLLEIRNAIEKGNKSGRGV